MMLNDTVRITTYKTFHKGTSNQKRTKGNKMNPYGIFRIQPPISQAHPARRQIPLRAHEGQGPDMGCSCEVKVAKSTCRAECTPTRRLLPFIYTGRNTSSSALLPAVYMRTTHFHSCLAPPAVLAESFECRRAIAGGAGMNGAESIGRA